MKEDIIDNYRDLPLGDYQEIMRLCQDETLDELTRQVGIICILTGRDEEYILNLPIPEYKELALRASFLEGGFPDTSGGLSQTYILGDFRLVPVIDIRKVTTAQYIDFQTFHQAGMEEHFAEILSCLLVPEGKKYNQDYDIIEVQSAIRKNLSVYDAMVLYGFFMVSCKESMKDILTFSMQEAKKIKDKQTRERTEARLREQLSVLMKLGDGSQM